MFSKRTQITALGLWYSLTQGGFHLIGSLEGNFRFGLISQYGTVQIVCGFVGWKLLGDVNRGVM